MMLCIAQWCRFANVSGKHRIIANEMSSIIMRSIISYCRRRCIICVRVQIHTQNYWKHLFHSPLTVESLDAQYACGAFFFAYASVLAPKCHHFCLRQTPGRAWSRYALRVFSVTKCTSRVLAGIFLSLVDSVTLDAIRIGFSVIFIFQSRFKVYLFHSPNTAERWTPSVWVWRCFYLCNTIISYVYFVHQTQNDIERSRLL